MDIYIADVSCFNDEKLYNGKINELSVWRKQKIISSARKNSFLSVGAGLIFNHALKKYGIDGRTAELYINSSGKPYLKNHGIYFNISHSGKYVLCAVGMEELGADIQKTGKYDIKVVDRFFHRNERLYIASLPNDRQAAAFFRMWALKESYIKALGKSIAGIFDSFSIKVSGETAAAYIDDELLPYRFIEYKIGEYFISVCTKEIIDKPLLRWVDFSK